MARTQSLSFPNMFDISRNSVSVIDDTSSIVNRCKLLILTEPTELYHSPNFGVGLKKYMFTYNNSNQRAIIKDVITAQLAINEPCVDANKTEFADSLLFSESSNNVTPYQDHNSMKMTVALFTKFGDNVEVEVDGNN